MVVTFSGKRRWNAKHPLVYFTSKMCHLADGMYVIVISLRPNAILIP